MKDSIANAEKLLIKDFGEFTANDLRGLLRFSKKNGFFEETVNFNGVLMFHYYRHKDYDSLHKYTQSLTNLLKLSNSNDLRNRNIIRAHLHLAYILGKQYGYTPAVMELYDRGYELSIKEKYCRGIIGIQLEKTELILKNSPSIEKLEEELSHIQQLIDDHWEDNIRHHDISGVMAKTLLALGEYDEAKKWAVKSVDYGNNYITGVITTLLSRIYYAEGNNSGALQSIRNAIVCLKGPVSLNDALAEAYYYEFLYLKSLEDNYRAIDSLAKAIELSSSIVNQIKYLEELIQYIKESDQWGDIKKLEDRKEKLLTFVAKVGILNNGEFFISKLDQKQLKNSNRILGSQISQLSVENGVLVFLLALFLILGFIGYKSIQKEKTKLVEVIPKQKKELLRREDELRLVAMKINNRVDKLRELKSIVLNIKAVDPNLKNVRTELNQLITSGEDITHIGDQILQEYSGITNMLRDKYPNLSDTQIRYCILTKLNLSIKEIADVICVAPTTVKHAKSMIKKKLGFDKELSLRDYLQQVFEEELDEYM
ncbi:hypothetical protein [uncultured Aquimarina sp.]|uniref:hypothetical protein n=1 Tax=uncultured Aquimarina sp. TaxID=575652 RepID=UPI00262C27C1|nr:hypothetical protein [uncultured Aquimarina sp.]